MKTEGAKVFVFELSRGANKDYGQNGRLDRVDQPEIALGREPHSRCCRHVKLRMDKPAPPPEPAKRADERAFLSQRYQSAPAHWRGYRAREKQINVVTMPPLVADCFKLLVVLHQNGCEFIRI
jgi:hypothetical protein